MSTYYVTVPDLWQYDVRVSIRQLCNARGIGVGYSSGGWLASTVSIVVEHLFFDTEEDAIVFILSYGGKLHHSLPTEPYECY